MAFRLAGRKSWLVLGWSWALTWPAAAQVARPEVAFRFQAPAGCGSAGEFSRAAQQRLPTVDLVERGRSSPVLVILTRHGKSVRAELLIALEGGRRLTRALNLESCDEAVEAMAFVAAIALDPDAEEPLDIVDEVDDDDAPLDAANGEKVVEDEQPVEDSGSSTAESTAVQDVPDMEPRGQTGAGVEWRVSAFGAGGLGPAPRPLWGGGVSGALLSAESGWWAPSVQWAVDWSRIEFDVSGPGSAEFILYRAAVELCPSRWNWRGLSVLGCGRVERGLLVAKGADISVTERHELPWFAAGLSLTGEVLVSDYWGFLLAIDGGFPVFRDRFELDERAFHLVPKVSANARAGVTFRIP